jgi:hypothetical protein
MAELGQRGLDQPALHRIVIDYEYGTCHDYVGCPPWKSPWIILAQGSK